MSAKVLIACEESQTVCKAFRARGYEAYSCDIQELSGGHPEWHIMQDVIPLKPTRKEPLPKEQRTHGIWKAHFEGKKLAWNDPETAKLRSKTPDGVAEAMAEQWGCLL